VKIFILEDNEFRIKTFKQSLIGHSVDIVTTVKDGRPLVEEKYDLIFLDHDLGGETYVPSGPETGYEMAQIISETVNKDTPTIIHSCNHAGSTSISFVLPHAKRVPFSRLDISFEVSEVSKSN